MASEDQVFPEEVCQLQPPAGVLHIQSKHVPVFRVRIHCITEELDSLNACVCAKIVQIEAAHLHWTMAYRRGNGALDSHLL
jgi:hypothetical protein